MTDDEISDSELAAMKARVEATTPGPWTSWFEGRDHTSGDSFIETATQDIHLTAEDYAGGGGHFCADQDFIAHAKQDLPRLIAEVERLRSCSSEGTVARARFLLEKTDGTRTAVEIVIGRPYVVDAYEARCSVRLEGLRDRVVDISGVGTLQALSLATDFAHRNLATLLEQGHSLFSDVGEPENEASIAAAFGRTSRSREGGG